MPATDALDAESRDARADNPTPPEQNTEPEARKSHVIADRLMIEPGKPEDVKATKAGSEWHLMAEALSQGATIEELMATLGWNKDTVTRCPSAA